jgi:hypothetical protein
MRSIIIAGVLGAALGGCSQVASVTGVSTTPGETDGQLFCAISKSDGTTEIASIINAVEPGAVIVTGIASFVVADECNKAAVVAGGVSAVPVPPTTPAAAVAIVPPVQTPATS